MSQPILRPRTRGGLTSRSLLADLEALGWKADYRQSSRLARTLEALVGELAALTEISDGNKSVPSDREGRTGVLAHEMPIPSFDPAGASLKLVDAEKRLWGIYEWLSSVVIRPQGVPCAECGRRERMISDLCGSCAAKILREARRG